MSSYTMRRLFSLLVMLIGGCAGTPPKAPERIVHHNEGLCLKMESVDAQEIRPDPCKKMEPVDTQQIRMQLCNCSSRKVHVDVNSIPWEAVMREEFTLSYPSSAGEIEIHANRWNGFTDWEPGAYYSIPSGECMDKKVSLIEMFDAKDLSVAHKILRWSGEIRGRSEDWEIQSELKFDEGISDAIRDLK